MKNNKLKILYTLLAVFGIVYFLSLGVLTYMIASNYNGIGNLVKAFILIKGQYLYSEDITLKQLIEGSIEGMVGSLDDPYSAYLSPEMLDQLNEQIQGSFGGLGILVSKKDEYIEIVRPIKNTPAYRAGLKAGDLITHIDDQDVKDMNLDMAVKLMRGPVGTKISLTVMRPGMRPGENEIFTVEITREEIKVPSVDGHMIEGEDIGYIALMKFNVNTPGEIRNTLNDLFEQGAKAIILDLRNNPGGEFLSGIEVADEFLSEGAIVYIDHKLGKDETYWAEPPAIDVPLVVVQNERTISAAEILAGAIKDNERGILVGTNTFGKALVQTVFQLGDGAGLKLTTARYLTPDGHDINEKGISPDVYVEQPLDSAEDLQLSKAIEIIKTKI
ncbi:S41 family peptidase [Peptococcaceae bacterium]|nr:S41 family peptidase [Peptococcaceae bacterium]